MEFLLPEVSRFPEWVTSVAFYKALHVVDSAIASQGDAPPSDHRAREMLLKKDPEYQQIWKHYRPLWSASSVARYLSDLDGGDFRSFTDFLRPDQVVSQMIRHRLHQVEESAIRMLGTLGPTLRRVI